MRVRSDLGPGLDEFGEERWLYAVRASGDLPPLDGWTAQAGAKGERVPQILAGGPTITVTEAGHSTTNGTYNYLEMHNGKPALQKVGSDVSLPHSLMSTPPHLLLRLTCLHESNNIPDGCHRGESTSTRGTGG